MEPRIGATVPIVTWVAMSRSDRARDHDTEDRDADREERGEQRAEEEEEDDEAGEDPDQVGVVVAPLVLDVGDLAAELHLDAGRLERLGRGGEVVERVAGRSRVRALVGDGRDRDAPVLRHARPAA